MGAVDNSVSVHMIKSFVAVAIAVREWAFIRQNFQVYTLIPDEGLRWSLAIQSMLNITV